MEVLTAVQAIDSLKSAMFKESMVVKEDTLF